MIEVLFLFVLIMEVLSHLSVESSSSIISQYTTLRKIEVVYKLAVKNIYTSTKPVHQQPKKQIHAKGTIEATHFLNKTKLK